MMILTPFNIYLLLLTSMVGACYYFYNLNMFEFINKVVGYKPAFWKYSILTFVLNYGFFIIISKMNMYLIVNWTLFAIFLIIEIQIFYKFSLKFSLYAGIQGAMVGLAINFITRSGIALLLNEPLVAFDAYVSNHLINYKPFPIALGFIISALLFYWLRNKFTDIDTVRYVMRENEKNLNFILGLSAALFLYLDSNLLIYFTPAEELFIKIWGMKSGICVLIGYCIAIEHVYTLTRIEYFEGMANTARESLLSQRDTKNMLQQIVYTDSLTGCSSRNRAIDELNKLILENNSFHVCFADLNYLKAVNDELGHDAGDRYLVAVAHSLDEVTSNSDIVCRYGGDEFLLIAPGTEYDCLVSKLENVQWSLQQLSHTSEYPYKLSISYGIAHSNESDSVEGLLKLADERMYEQKVKYKETISNTKSE